MFLSHYKKWKSRSVSNTVTVRMKRLEEVSDQKELTVEFIQLFNQVRLFVNPWTTAHQASLSIINSWIYPSSCLRVGVAIQPPHLLLSPSPTFNRSQNQGLFKWVSSFHQVAKVLQFQLHHQSFQWISRTDFLYPLQYSWASLVAQLVKEQSYGVDNFITIPFYRWRNWTKRLNLPKVTQVIIWI